MVESPKANIVIKPSNLPPIAVIDIPREVVDRCAQRLNIPDDVWEHDSRVIIMALKSWLGDI